MRQLMRNNLNLMPHLTAYTKRHNPEERYTGTKTVKFLVIKIKVTIRFNQRRQKTQAYHRRRPPTQVNQTVNYFIHLRPPLEKF